MSAVFISPLSDSVFLAKVVNFIIFVGAIVWVYNKFGKPMLVAHQEAENKAVEDAVAHRAEREVAVAAAQRAIEQAKVDAVRMVEVGRAQAARLVEDERAAAREHAQRILAYANGELERERYRVRRELLEETVERAHARAQEMAKREIDPAKQHTLVERLISNLERARA